MTRAGFFLNDCTEASYLDPQTEYARPTAAQSDLRTLTTPTQVDFPMW
jgi:hypothetical protein